jgi:ABC-type transport system involved in multi-copper enzyme maturation permease subunit
MTELVMANLRTNLAFYRRSRLLLAFAIVFLVITALSSLPAIFFTSGVQGFRTLHEIFTTLNGCLLFLVGALGLFIISSHLRSRCLKMVFTKPCSPGLWLASAFLSAVLVSLLLNGVILGAALGLSLFWHVPVRAALVFLSAENFVISVGIVAYLMVLSSVLHPAIAVTFILIFNAETFYNFATWTQGAVRSGNSSLYLRALEKLFHFLYLLLPMTHAFGKKMEGVASTLRVSHADWKYLIYAAGYVIALSAFCYFIALLAFQRKKHI